MIGSRCPLLRRGHSHKVVAPCTQLQTRSRRYVAVQALASQGSGTVELVATVSHLIKWLQANGAAQTNKLEPKRFRTDVGERVGLIAACDTQADSVLLEIPESLAVTAIDAEKHELIGPIAKECSELVALTLWLMAEKAQGAQSAWSQLLQTLPDSTASPILWEDQDRVELLTGSPVLTEARQRHSALQQQWATLSSQHRTQAADRFNPTVFNETAFIRAFCVVLACTTYLPAAQCFAIVPVACSFDRTGNDNGCNLDYDANSQTVKVTAGRPYRWVTTTRVLPPESFQISDSCVKSSWQAAQHQGQQHRWSWDVSHGLGRARCYEQQKARTSHQLTVGGCLLC